MKGIYYKEGIYVLINSEEMHADCVYHEANKYNKKSSFLYGGRIHIDQSYDAHFTIDGIRIVMIQEISISRDLSLSTITSYLNAIEANGVDAFIEHYKQSIKFLYNELKEINQKTESQLSIMDNELKRVVLMHDLEGIRKSLFAVLAIFFSLQTYMSAALENEKVTSVCQSIIDSII